MTDPNKQTRTHPPSVEEVVRGGTALLRSVQFPIFSVADSKVCGYELLIRGPGELASPERLFAAGTSPEILAQLDHNALTVSLETSKSIPEQLRVHINLFAETLLDVEDIEAFIHKLKQGRTKGCLCIEIIEMKNMPQPPELTKRARCLREAGFEVALDDVGYGASSIEALIKLEPTVLKIDRSFVTRAYENVDQAKHYERMVRVARSLECVIVAEGVDSEEDRLLADSLGIEMGQGLLTGPLPV